MKEIWNFYRLPGYLQVKILHMTLFICHEVCIKYFFFNFKIQPYSVRTRELLTKSLLVFENMPSGTKILESIFVVYIHCATTRRRLMLHFV